MQEIQCNKQSTSLREKLYYVNQDYIIQDSFVYNSPILIKRNGGGSSEKVKQILLMCNLEVDRKIDEHLLKLKAKV